ncbi:hypothetical protein JYU34_014688, partial [Plutella xylostella]
WSHCLQSGLTTCTVILLPAQWSHCLHSGPTVCIVGSGYSVSAQTRLRPQPPRHSALSDCTIGSPLHRFRNRNECLGPR